MTALEFMVTGMDRPAQILHPLDPLNERGNCPRRSNRAQTRRLEQ